MRGGKHASDPHLCRGRENDQLWNPAPSDLRVLPKLSTLKAWEWWKTSKRAFKSNLFGLILMSVSILMSVLSFNAGHIGEAGREKTNLNVLCRPTRHTKSKPWERLTLNPTLAPFMPTERYVSAFTSWQRMLVLGRGSVLILMKLRGARP